VKKSNTAMVVLTSVLKWLALAASTTIAYLLAYVLRFDVPVPGSEWARFWNTLPLLLAARTLANWYWGLTRKWWRFVSLPDVTGLCAATGAGSAAFVLIQLFAHLEVPRSLLLMEPALTLLLVGGMMIISRTLHEGRPSMHLGVGKRVLIVGAGRAGDRVAREMRQNGNLNTVPVAFVDDDPKKEGCLIQGVPVLGTVAEIGKLVSEYQIQDIIIAMPSARGRRMRELVETCERTGVRFRVLPATSDVMNGRVTVNRLREARIEDLLPRSPIALDLTAVRPLIEGSVVCVTGAGGSIGSELCRQIATCNPTMLMMVDRYENNLYYLETELAERFPRLRLWAIVADITDLVRMEPLIAAARPRIVFNAAACKHVPLMEENPSEAIRNNVFGTRVMAQLAEFYGVERMVQISTDKAINPTSVMGASKRLAELALQGMQPTSRTRFVTVRFGNVLGSEGSCVQLFARQIARGGPVTVTHPEVVRYFMSVDEAVRLVLNASALGEGGEIFLLDMGEPVRILDLATAMIRLSGVEAHDDIEVRFTGLRPGEKLYEELITDSEVAAPTSHPKIFKLREQNQRDWKLVQKKIIDLEKLAIAGEAGHVRDGIRTIVPEYTPTDNGHVLNYEAAASSRAAAEEQAAARNPETDAVRLAVVGGSAVRRNG
jgi:FlaA1/EpsC-like NDP-sugar epimerase